MNTYSELELSNGQKLKLTLNLKRLLILKSNHLDLYKEANKIITKGADDIFDMVKVLYAAYLCALEIGAEEMNYETFLNLVSDLGFGDITEKVGNLIQPKKK